MLWTQESKSGNIRSVLKIDFMSKFFSCLEVGFVKAPEIILFMSSYAYMVRWPGDYECFKYDRNHVALLTPPVLEPRCPIWDGRLAIQHESQSFFYSMSLSHHQVETQ